jgi:hypothetical protein
MKQASAFLLAPVPAAVLGSIVSWSTGGYPRPFSVILFYLLLFYCVQLVFGLPLRLLLAKRGRDSAMAFGAAGIAMVALPAIPYMAWAMSRPQDAAQTGPIVLVMWLALGGITGLTYWWLIRNRRLPGRESR